MAEKGVKLNLRFRAVHRWLGFFVGIQLFLWTVSGFYFSWHKIEKVRGEDLMSEPEKTPLTRSIWLLPVWL